MRKINISKIEISVIIVVLFAFTAFFTACKKNEVATPQTETKSEVSAEARAGNPCTCTSYSSQEGYCTAGVRLDKGGCTYKGSVYCGVMFNGDAKDWYDNAKKAKFSVGSTPTVGSIVVWPGNSVSSVGHVGVVTKKDESGAWWYKAMNDYPNGFNAWSERKIKDYPSSKKPVSPTGYIYSWK